MLKKVIQYTDLFGNKKESTFYFGFMKSDLVMMQSSNSGGLENHLKNIIETSDNDLIMKNFEKIILDAYGEKSEDGQSFDKTDEARRRFRHSPAFDVLFMELLNDTDKAIEFVRGIMPDGVDISDELEDVKSIASTEQPMLEG